MTRPKLVPPLDPHFRPAAIEYRSYLEQVRASPAARSVTIALERANGHVAHFRTLVPGDSALPGPEVTFQIERLLKFLLWSRGAFRVLVTGPRELTQQLRKHYTASAAARF